MHTFGIVETAGSFHISFSLTTMFVSSKDRSSHVEKLRSYAFSFFLSNRKEKFVPCTFINLQQIFPIISLSRIRYWSPFLKRPLVEIIRLPLMRLAYPMSEGKFLSLHCCHSVKEGWKGCQQSSSIFTVYFLEDKTFFSVSFLDCWLPGAQKSDCMYTPLKNNCCVNISNCHWMTSYFLKLYCCSFHIP